MSTDSQQNGKKRVKKQKTRPSKKIRFDEECKQENPCLSLSSGDDEVVDGDTEDDIDWKKLEEVLEESAHKANLTAVNVKSILHHILRDKRVIDYAQNVAEFDGASPLPDDKIAENTNMTRAKAKLLGQQPLLSVLETPKKKILDINFSESSSSDEDYEPAGHVDTEASQTSDDDFSEIFSDITSDLRSPRSVLSVARSEPLTPSLERISEEITGCDEPKEATIKIATPTKMQLFPNATASAVPNTSTETSDIDLISSRTRSQYPLRDIELEELEALFQPPDFEPSNIRVEELDDDELIWHGWLSDLTKPSKSTLNDTCDDVDDDEDFNYMAAAEEEDTEFDEELRDDRATRITQKELQELFNELLLGYNRDVWDNCDEIIQELCDDRGNDNRSSQKFSYPSDEMMNATKDLNITYEQRQQMTAQLQQHMHLLTQVYMLSCTQPTLRDETHQCKQYVEELALFHDKAVENSQECIGSLSADLSMFCTPGISDAYGIMKSLVGQKIITKTPKNSNAANKKRNLPISDTIANIFATHPYFATYIELLPKQGIQNGAVKDRVRRMKFLQCEDNLLALGLHQFKGQGKFDLITQHLLPLKEPRQLQIRVKNACTMRLKYNPIAVVKKEKYLPEFENKLNIIIPRDVSTVPLFKLARGIWKNRLMPGWYSKLCKSLTTREKERKTRDVLMEYERKNDLFNILQKTNKVENTSNISPHAPNIPHSDFAYSTPVQQIQNTNQNIAKIFHSAPVVRTSQHQLSIPLSATANVCMDTTTVKPNVDTSTQPSPTNKQRVNRSLIYSESSAAEGSASVEPLTQQQSNVSGVSQCQSKENISADGFSLPVNVLFKDLQVPESLPNLNFSPSKPLHETSFSDVKHFLKTPQKGGPPNKPSRLTPMKNLVGGRGGIIDVCNNDMLRTPQKIALIQEDLNDSAAELSAAENSPMPSIASPGDYRTPIVESYRLQNTLKSPLAGQRMETEVVQAIQSPLQEHYSSIGNQMVTNTQSEISNQISNHQLSEVLEGKPLSMLESIRVLCQEVIVAQPLLDTAPGPDQINMQVRPQTLLESTASPGQGNTAVRPQPISGAATTPDDQNCNTMPLPSTVPDESHTELTKVVDKPCESVTTNPGEHQMILASPPDYVTTKKDHNKRSLTKKSIHFKRKKKPVFNYDERLKQRAVDFAEIYFTRVRQVLADRPDLCRAFFVLMQSVNKHLSKLETYHKLADILYEFPELVDNYVGFLEQHEARHIGKYMEWLQFDLVIRFHLQCEQHFFGTPGHYKKITKKILDVTSRTQHSREIVNEVVPLFQGEHTLRDLFIRLFPDLSPPPCNDDDFEVIDFGAVSSGMKEIDDFEEIPYQPPDFDQSLVLLTEDEAIPAQSHHLHAPSATIQQQQTIFKSSPGPVVKPFPSEKAPMMNYSKQLRCSSKNITAKKLKQLASKRKKKMREERARQFRASPTSGEDEYHGDDDEEEYDEGYDYDEFMECCRHFGDEEEWCPTHNTDNEKENVSKDAQQQQTLIHTPKPHAEISKLDQQLPEPCQTSPVSDKHPSEPGQHTPKSPDEHTSWSSKQAPNLETEKLSKHTSEPGDYASKPGQHALDKKCASSTSSFVQADEESNMSIRSSDNIFCILKKESFVKPAKERSLNASDLTFSEHSHGSDVVNAHEKISLLPKTKKNEEVKVIQTVADSILDSSVDVDFNVVSSAPVVPLKPTDDFVIDLCSVSSTGTETTQATDITMVERVLGTVEKETPEMDTEVESIMSRKQPPIPHVHFSTPKVKIFSPDMVGNVSGAPTYPKENDTLPTISIVSTVPSDSSFEEKKYSPKYTLTDPRIDKHPSLSLCNDLTFPEFPSQSCDGESTLLDNKTTAENNTLTPPTEKIESSFDVRKHSPKHTLIDPRLDKHSSISICNDLTFPEFPSQTRDEESEPTENKTTGENSTLIQKLATENSDLKHTLTDPRLDKHTSISLCNDLTFPEFPSATRDGDTLQDNKLTGEHSSKTPTIENNEGYVDHHMPQVSLLNDLTFPEYSLADKTVTQSPKKVVTQPPGESLIKSLRKTFIKSPRKTFIKSPRKTVTSSLGNAVHTENKRYFHIGDSSNSEGASMFSPYNQAAEQSPRVKVSPVSKDELSKDSQSGSLTFQASNSLPPKKPSVVKLPRRLSELEIVTITTEIDRSLFYSDDSMSSTISCLAPKVSPRKLKTINEMSRKKSTKKRRLKVKTLSERPDNKKEFFSDDDDYFESRSVESAYDPNSSLVSSPYNDESLSTRPPLPLKHSKSCPSIKKQSVRKREHAQARKPKRRLKSSEIKTIRERKERDEFSDEDNYFQSWSVESAYDPNSSFIGTPPQCDESSRQEKPQTSQSPKSFTEKPVVNISSSKDINTIPSGTVDTSSTVKKPQTKLEERDGTHTNEPASDSPIGSNRIIEREQSVNKEDIQHSSSSSKTTKLVRDEKHSANDKSVTQQTHEDISTVSTPKDDSTVPSLKDDSSVPSQKDISNDFIVQSQENNFTVPSREDVSTVPSQKDVSTVPNQRDVSTVLSHEDVSTILSQEENPLVQSQQDVSTVLIQEDVSTVPKQEDATMVTIHEGVSTVPSDVVNKTKEEDVQQNEISKTEETVANRSGSSQKDWTRGEDEFILITIQKHGGGDEAIQQIAKQFASQRTILEIKKRLDFLLRQLMPDADNDSSSSDGDYDSSSEEEGD